MRSSRSELVLLLILLSVGVASIPILTTVLDLAVYQENLMTGDDGVVRLNAERYYVQAIEAYVLGAAFGLAMLIGFIALFFFPKVQEILGRLRVGVRE